MRLTITDDGSRRDSLEDHREGLLLYLEYRQPPMPRDGFAEFLAGTLAVGSTRIVELVSRVAEFEARLGQDSQNWSPPPSRDGRDRRVRRAAERAVRKPARVEADGGQPRAQGKQPGAPGSIRTRRDRTKPDA